MSFVKNTISPSSFPADNVVRSTTNGTLIKMEHHGNRSYEKTSIPVSKQLLPTKNFYCSYEPKVMKSKVKNLEKMHPSISLSAPSEKTDLSVAV
jgi:hypothetical protein